MKYLFLGSLTYIKNVFAYWKNTFFQVGDQNGYSSNLYIANNKVNKIGLICRIQGTVTWGSNVFGPAFPDSIMIAFYDYQNNIKEQAIEITGGGTKTARDCDWSELDNKYVFCGRFLGNLSYGSYNFSAPDNSSGSINSFDSYIIKTDENANVIFMKHIPGVPLGNAAYNGGGVNIEKVLNIGSGQTVILGDVYDGSVTIDSFSFSTGPLERIQFIAILNDKGVCVSLKTISGNISNENISKTTDGGFLLFGQIFDTVSFSDGTTLSVTENNCYVVLKYNSNNVIQYARQFDNGFSENYTKSFFAAEDQFGKLIICGLFYTKLREIYPVNKTIYDNFDEPSGTYDAYMFIVKLNDPQESNYIEWKEYINWKNGSIIDFNVDENGKGFCLLASGTDQPISYGLIPDGNVAIVSVNNIGKMQDFLLSPGCYQLSQEKNSNYFITGIFYSNTTVGDNFQVYIYNNSFDQYVVSAQMFEEPEFSTL